MIPTGTTTDQGWPEGWHYLTENDVTSVVDMPDAVTAIEVALRALAAGQAANVPRTRVQAPGMVLHSMSAACAYLGLAGWKQYTTTSRGARFLVGVYAQADGELVALIEANRLGQIRTGAVTGVAVKYLTPATLSDMGLVGAGFQAEGQLRAVAAVRPLERVHVYCRDADRRTGFAQRMAGELHCDVIPVATAQEAVGGLPLVVTATTSRQPVLAGEWLDAGALVCAVGSNWLHKAELDLAAVRRARAVVCDSVECCRREAGDFQAALEAGAFHWPDAVELSAVVAGQATPPPGTQRPDSVLIFKSVGMALCDVALAALVLERRGIHWS